FIFNGKEGIAFNRVSGTGPGTGTARADIFGTMVGCVVACTNFGGNIWISAPHGVVIGNGAVINTGGLRGTTSPRSLPGADFLAGREPTSGGNHIFNFGQGANAISLGDAHITLNGGTLALIAPVVTSSANTPGRGVDGSGSVLYGAADAFRITLAPDGTNW